MKKYVVVELYSENFYDELCLTFDENVTEEHIQEVVDKEFNKFIDDVVAMETYNEFPEDEYEAVRADVATTCSCEWRYPEEGEFNEEYWD